jgi:hypothetical protein
MGRLQQIGARMTLQDLHYRFFPLQVALILLQGLFGCFLLSLPLCHLHYRFFPLQVALILFQALPLFFDHQSSFH